MVVPETIPGAVLFRVIVHNVIFEKKMFLQLGHGVSSVVITTTR